MTKICLLKADILRMHLGFKEISVGAIGSVTHDLQQWYEELPSLIRLETAGQDNVPVETQRSIMHVHLLYLGAIMLLYRRVASGQLLANLREHWNAESHIPSNEQLVDASHQAILAATTSARILKLLFDNNAIFARCWLVL